MAQSVSPISILAFAVALAIVHALAGRFRFRSIPRSYWLSGAGGVSVAYVFVHVLPELGARQHSFEVGLAESLEHHVYLLALVGFAAFYGLEQVAHESETSETSGTSEASETSKTSEDSETSNSSEILDRAETETSMGVFWLHIGSFAAYNAIIGYLLVHREESGLASLSVFALAMGLHFVVNDHGLREHHHDAYDGLGRWILAGGVLAGTAVGLATAVSEVAVSALFALLAGGVILNVVKEELPERRRSNFWAFGSGAAVYAVVLLFV